MQRTRTWHAVLAMALASCVALESAAAEWGDMVGRFVYDGKAPAPAPININKDLQCCTVKHTDNTLLVSEDGGIANVVIYVRTRKVDVHPNYAANANAKVQFDNVNCRFEPHILPVVLTQTLELKNSDKCSHNSNLQPLGDQAINPLIAAGGTQEHKFNRSQNIPQPVTCNIHPWMKGYVLPRDNPYVAVTDADGKFKLENLPQGELEFQAWHERVGYLATGDWKKGRFKQKIGSGTNDLGTVKVAGSLFDK